MNLEDLNNKEPNEIRIMIEEGKFNHLDQVGWLNLCTLLMKKYEKIEKYEIFRLIQKEILLTSFSSFFSTYHFKTNVRKKKKT